MMLKKFDAGKAKCGVYAIYIDDKVVYVGESIDLPNRIYDHEKGIRTGKGAAPWYYLAH